MASLDPISAVVSALKREEIIPDVLPEEFTPSVLFSIVYPNGPEALLSSELAPADTQEEPDINFTPLNLSGESKSEDEEPTYTLVLTGESSSTDVITSNKPQLQAQIQTLVQEQHLSSENSDTGW